MISLSGVSKSFTVNGEFKTVIDDLTLTLKKGRSIALLGRNGAGKSTLLQMIAGTLRPDEGEIHKFGTVSWPVGFSGSFHGDMTGAQNVRFVARLYGVDPEDLTEFVKDFSEIDDHLYAPVSTYSSGMKSRLAFATSMGIHFDMYLVDEITAVGDQRFRRKSKQVFRERMLHSSAILVTHNLQEVVEYCDEGLVLEGGKARHFSDLQEALQYHKYLQMSDSGAAIN